MIDRDSITVLLTDDSPEDRSLVRRLLERYTDQKYHIVERETGEQGLSYLRSPASEAIDCVLLDYHLPDMEAHGLLAELNPQPAAPIFPVVVLTSKGTEANAVRSLQAGAQDYLLKETLTASSLVSAIANAREKVTLQRQLRESESRLRHSLDRMLDCYGIYTAVRDAETGSIIDFRVEYINNAACQNNRMTREEQVGQLLCDLFPAYKFNGTLEKYIRIVENGESVDETNQECTDPGYVTKSGLISRLYDIRAWKMEDGFAASWREVTDRAQAEAAQKIADDRLAAAARTLRFHVENTPLANIEWDSEFRVRAWSRQAEIIFGWQASDVVGKPVSELAISYPEDATKVKAVIERLTDGTETGNVSLSRNCRNDGTVIWCEWYNSVERDEDGNTLSILSLVQDVTEREEARLHMDARWRREHNIAVTLQRSLLSHPKEDAFPGLRFHTLYEPAWSEADVGGDFYDVFSLSDGRVAFVIGDISGKGLAAARYIAEAKFSLRAYLNKQENIADALNEVNQVMCRSFNEQEEGLNFVCLTLAVVDAATGTVEVAPIGSEPPLQRRSNDEIVEWNGPAHLPLGIDENAVYTTSLFALEPGDLFLMVTDGVTEARQGNNFLGNEGLGRLLSVIQPDDPLGQIGAHIMKSASDYAGGTLSDDVCLLLVRRDVLPPQVAQAL